MAWARDRAHAVLLGIAALASSAALFYFGTGENPIWWATCLAPLPLLLAATRLPALAAFASSATAYFLGSLNMLRYTRNILALPHGAHGVTPDSAWIAILLFMVLPACIFATAVWLFRHYAKRGALWQAALLFPALWTAYEFLSACISPHGTFGNLSYTQMDVLSFLQIASVSGLWGIDFFLFLLPATLGALLVTNGATAQKRNLAFAVGAIIGLVYAFGMWRLQSVPSGAAYVRVGLIASDLPSNVDISDPGNPTQRKLRDYLDSARPLIDQGARIVILPEKLGVTIPATSQADDSLFQTFSNRGRTDVVVGLIRKSGHDLLNEARVYVPGRATALTYDKHHMLPAFESRLTPGKTTTLMSRPSGLWGVEVCKDMDFPALSRDYGNDGIGLLLVAAWDFDDDAWLHDRMAVMRGVESGFTIVRAAKEGLLSASDDRGRILAERSSASAPFASLVVNVPVRHDPTFYDRFGDWFAWLDIAALLGILAVLPWMRTRS